MKYIVISKLEFSKLLDSYSLTLNNLKSWEIFSPNYFTGRKKIKKQFSFFLFFFGLTVFLCAMVFQFWANSIENFQILGSKPFFHFSTGFIFAFELSLFFVGMIIFIRFMVVNDFHNKHIPVEVKELILNLKEDQLLLLFFDDVKDLPQFLQEKMLAFEKNI